MKAFLGCIFTILGACLIVDGQRRVSEMMRQREFNPLELKRSPYGEIIGAALQEPVHMLSHGGVGHEHGDPHGHGADGHTHDHSAFDSTEDKPWLVRRKIHLASLEGETRRNHNPSGRKVESRAYEKKRIWELMEMAYGMDPTNYANYTIYVDLASREGGFDKILEVSNNTLQLTDGKLNDPNDSLTAAAAAEVLLIYRDRDAKKRGVENMLLESDYDFFIAKKEEFATSFDKALAEGRLLQFSQEKVDEMILWYSRFEYTTHAYKKYINDQKLKKSK